MLATKRGAFIGMIVGLTISFVLIITSLLTENYNDYFAHPPFIIFGPLVVLIFTLWFGVYGMIVDILLKVSRRAWIDYFAGFIVFILTFSIEVASHEEGTPFTGAGPVVAFFIVLYLSSWARKKKLLDN